MSLEVKNVYNLIRLNYKASRPQGEQKISTKCLTYVLSVLFGAIIGLVFFSLCKKLGAESFKGLLSVQCLGFQLFLLSYAITDLYKLLFANTDKEILAYLPVTKRQIYISKIIYCYLRMFLLFACLSVPCFLIYGVLNSVAIWYYFSIIFVVLLLPILPFGIANVLIFPITFLLIWLKHKLVLKLILMAILTVVVFFVYNNLIFEIANILLLDSANSNIIISLADKLANALLPFGIFARFMLADRMLTTIFVILLLSLVSLGIGLTIGLLSYKNIFQIALADKNNSKEIKSKTKCSSPFKAFLDYEIKSLFRNSTYLFVYFVMAVSMPIMVALCNGFILEFAISKVGSSIMWGVTLFVIMCFVSIICSPTASFISKEGENFWIIKTNPHGIKYPLIAKSVVGVVCAGCSLFATLIAVLVQKHISILFALVILLIVAVFIVGLVSFGINLNLFRPNLFKSNRENNSNIAIHILVSFIIFILVGVLGILGVFMFPPFIITLIIGSIVLTFTIINVLVLILLSKKLYLAMEV